VIGIGTIGESVETSLRAVTWPHYAQNALAVSSESDPKMWGNRFEASDHATISRLRIRGIRVISKHGWFRRIKDEADLERPASCDSVACRKSGGMALESIRQVRLAWTGGLCEDA